MDKTIWKYEIPIEDSFTLEMPLGAEVIHVATQGGVPCLWALVCPDEEAVRYRFCLRGTGHDASGIEAKNHLGTFFLHGGSLVFHLFRGAHR